MRKSVKWRFFLSYLAIVIPLIALLAVALYATAGMLEEELTYSSELRLRQTCAEFEREIESIKDTADRIYIDNELTRTSMARSEYYALKGISALQRFISGDEFLKEIGVSFFGVELYTSNGMYYADVYAARELQIDANARVDFKRALIEETGEAFRFYGKNPDGEATLVCVAHVPRASGNPTAGIVFELNSGAIKKQLQNLIGDYSGLAALTLGDELVVSAGDGNPDILFTSAPGILAGRTELGMGLAVNLALETGEIMSRVIRLRYIALFTLSAGLLLASAVSYCLSVRNYHPIRGISRMLGMSEEQVKSKNELDAIHAAIGDTIAEKHKLSALVDESRRVMRNQYRVILFHGLIDDEVQLKKMLVSAQFKLEGKPRWACVVALAPGGEALEALKREFPLSIDWRVDGRDALAIAVGLESDEGEREQLEVLSSRIGEAIGAMSDWQLGAGRAYAGLSSLHRSLIEAAAALKAALRDSRRLTLFSELFCLTGEVKPNIDSAWRARMNAALVKADSDETVRVLDEANALVASESNFGARQYDCYSIIHALYAHTLELGLEQRFSTDIMSLDTSDADAFFRELRELAPRIIVASREERRSNGQIAEIVKYVREHFADRDLSMDFLAERFGLSKSYLSRLFKDELGRNYIDYLSELRIAQARKLLRETNLSVREIVESVGYLDPISFNRKFKQFHGVSPTEYRKNNREGARVG